ncbi:MAG TPA: GEVED domain-containing protein, partial [Catalimonadaceae bacterium]|nr:GEVED domain-containing protein [Catalimonadaceae bacterium]
MSDLNGDQKQDLILATPNVEVYQNNSNPGSLAAANFSSPISLNTDGIDNFVYRTVVCGDFDGDGKLDLFSIRPSSTEASGVQMALFRNTTAINGTLLPSQFVKSTFTNPFVAAGVIASDMDKDGKTDLVVTTSSDYRIYRNRGNDAYCIPVSDGCGQFSDPPTTAIIQGVRLVNQSTSANQVLSAATGCSGGYANYALDPARYANVQTGQIYNAIFDLAGNAGNYPLGVKIWGDFNQDSDFDDSGELLYAVDQLSFSSSMVAPIQFPNSVAPGNYRIRVRATAYSSTDFGYCDAYSGETEDYTAVISNYCIPSYTQSCLTNNFFINSVQLGSSSLVNAGCNGQRDNYTQDLPNNQFPNRKFTVLAGSSNSLSIGLGITGQVAVWIDYNNDKSFATTELVALSSVSSAAHSFTVTIPSTTATLGLKRMRVRSLNGSITNAQACATLAGYGETEDFLVEIRHNPGTITTRRDTICNGGTPAAIAFATNPTGGTSFNYDWYYKPGIQAQPSGLPEENGWIFIPTANVSGQTFPNYAPT